MEFDTHRNHAVWKEPPWDAAGGTPQDCSLSPGGTALLVVAYGAVLALGLIGNSCLALVMARHRELRGATDVLIVNLACADVLMGAVCLPVTIVYTLMDRWVLGEALCKLTPFVQCVAVTVSVSSLALVALERHQLVVHPTGWRPAVRQARLAAAATWLAAGALSAPFLSYNVLAFPFGNVSAPFLAPEHPVCMERWPTLRRRRAYFAVLLLVQFLAPLALVAVCYLRIFLRLRKRKELRDADRKKRTTRRRKTRINAVLASIVAAYVLSWLPLTVFNAVFDWDHEALPACHDAIFSACHLAAMTSTCVNPVLYGFLNGNFRRHLRAALAGGVRCRGAAAAASSAAREGEQQRYESVPLSTVGTEDTKGTALSNGSAAFDS